MATIITSAIMTCSIYLLHVYWKCKQKPFVYFLLFFAFMGANFFVNQLYAENDLKAHMLARELYFTKKEKEDDHKQHKLTKREIYEDYRKVCINQLEYHREEAQKCYEEAERIIDSFPDINEKDKANICLNAAFAAALPAEPSYRILTAALLMLQQVASSMVSQWQQLDTKLHEARSHAELYEHYRQTEIYMRRLISIEPKQSSKLILTE